MVVPNNIEVSKIEITIKSQETKLSLTVEEARDLHKSLDELFGSKVPIWQECDPLPVLPYYDHTGTSND